LWWLGPGPIATEKTSFEAHLLVTFRLVLPVWHHEALLRRIAGRLSGSDDFEMEKGFRDQGCGASTHFDELHQIWARSRTGREFKENSKRFTGARVIEMHQFVGGKCPLPVIFLCQLRQMTREATLHASQREAAHAPDTDAILRKRLDVAD
jgi:hypothetical protein